MAEQHFFRFHLQHQSPTGLFVLSTLLYSYTCDYMATSIFTTIVECVCNDDTVVVGLISENYEKTYLEEIKHLEKRYQDIHLRNVSKKKHTTPTR